MTTTLRRLSLSLGVVLCVQPAFAADRWVRVRTDHFDLVGNAGDTDVRRIAQTLEQFHGVVASAVLTGVGTLPSHTTVLVFKDDFSFTPYKPQGAGRSFIGGLTILGDGDALLAMNAENLNFAFRSVLHGYAAAIAERAIGNVPLWLGTGLGQFYQTFEERNGGKGALIGRADTSVVEVLKAGTLLPLASLITLDATGPGMVLGSASRRLFDAESWALVHYLSLGARKEQFQRYLGALRVGGDPAQSFRAAVGDLEPLERELREYVRKFAFPAIQLQFDERMKPAMPPRAEVLNEAESEAYLASMLARSGYSAQARSRLEKALAAAPDSASVTAALARIEISEDRLERGLPLLERAATLAPGDERVQAELGHYLAIEVARKGSGSTPEDLTRARAVLTRANELDPNNMASAAELGWMLLFQPDAPARAAALLTRAVEGVPSREQYKLWLAEALLRDGQFAAARGYLGPLMARGSTPDIQSQARRLLGTLGERQTAARSAGPSASSAGAGASATGAASAASTPPLADPVSPPEANRSPSASSSRPAGASDYIPVLRVQRSGESRVLGLFSAVECAAGTVTLVVNADDRVYRLAGPLSDVEFLSYRQDAPGSVGCGPMNPPQRVLATFRASTQPGATNAGTAVAIELLPDDYSPR